MMQNSELLETWVSIARFLKVSERTARSMKQELLSGGFIFYRFRRSGSKAVKVVCAFPSRLLDFLSEKSTRGEIVGSRPHRKIPTRSA